MVILLIILGIILSPVLFVIADCLIEAVIRLVITILGGIFVLWCISTSLIIGSTKLCDFGETAMAIILEYAFDAGSGPKCPCLCMYIYDKVNNYRIEREYQRRRLAEEMENSNEN